MATYNCTDSSNSAYGSNNYGTCTSQSVGAPNTGVFSQVLSDGTFTIAIPFFAAIIIAAISIAFSKKRRHAKSSGPAE